MRRSVSIFRVLACAVLVLAALPTTFSRADVSASGDFVPGTISDAGGDLGALLIIGDTGVAGLFMDAAPPLFGTLTPLRAVDGIIGNETESIGAITLEDFRGGDLVLTNSFIVGNAGQGFLDLFDSASVNVEGIMTIGALQEGLGLATINGQGSRVITEDLIVGDLGIGNLELNNRASVRSVTGYIGNGDGSVGTVVVTGVGTRWSVGTETPNTDGQLFIGNVVGQGDIGQVNNDAQLGQGQGILRIANQGLVQVSDEVIIGPSGRLELETQGRLRILPTSEAITGNNNNFLDVITNQGVILGDGFVDFVGVIDGPTNSQSSRPLIFLNTAAGEIRNAAGLANQREKLVFTSTPLNGDFLLNLGLIETLGGEMEFRTIVDNANNILARDGVLRFEDGLIGTAATGDLILSGTTTVHGLISGNAISVLPGSVTTVVGGIRFSSPLMDFTDEEEEVSAPLLIGPGMSLSIGDNPGTLTVIGNLDLTGGVLDLDVTTLGVPTVGDVFEVVTIPGGTGTFGMFSNNTVIAGGYQFNVGYDPDSVLVTFAGLAAGPMGADFDGNGIVDAADLAIWQANFGTTGPLGSLDALGDADSDGDVDGRDFLRIQREFGGPGVEPIVANLVSVPEPSALVLLLSAGVACFARRRK